MSRHHTPAADRPIAASSLFAGLSRREVRRVAALCTRLHRPAGDVLAREGQHGRQFIVILSGQALATVDGKIVDELAAGSHIGTSVIDKHTLYRATVTTITPTEILVFSVPGILDLIQENPLVRARLEATGTPHTTAAPRPLDHENVEAHDPGYQDDDRLDPVRAAMASAHAGG